MSATLLDYEPAATHTGVIINERSDGGVTITVPSRRRTFGAVLHMLGDIHPLAAVAAPVVWPLFRAFASSNPRAVLRLTPDEFVLTETSDTGPGYVTTARSWPRSSLGELRPNRYVNGLYLRVPGKENVDLLQDLPPATIEAIGTALSAAESRLAGRRQMSLHRGYDGRTR